MEPKSTANNASKVIREYPTASLATANANHLVLFGQHETTLEARLLPDRTSLLMLEDSEDWRGQKHAYTGWKKDPQYGSIIEKAAFLKIPIYFGDPQISPTHDWIDNGVFAAETFAGVVALGFAGKAAVAGKNLTPRRRFLQSMGLGALGAYLTSPAVSGLFLDRPGEVFAKARLLSRASHPESMRFTIGFRDTVMAYKQQWLAENRHSGKCPFMVTAIGAHHIGFESILLQAQSEKLSALRSFQSSFTSLLPTPETFYSIQEHTPDGQINTLIVPELHSMWKEASKGTISL